MCICFFFINPNPSPDTFRFILAMNRDEAWDRPTMQADWKVYRNREVLCGRDMTPKKSGGTWLAVGKNAKIGFVTNIKTEKYEKDGKGRGFLVLDYVDSEASPKEFLDELANEQSVYNPFNLCLIQLKKDAAESWWYCRGKEGHVIETKGPFRLDEGIHAQSNDPPSEPFRKTSYGKGLFKEIIEENNQASNSEILKEKLLTLLNNNEMHFPDPQMAKQMGISTGYEQCCSIFIKNEESNYGTTCQTVILIKNDFSVEYVERSRLSKTVEWETKKFNFVAQP